MTALFASTSRCTLAGIARSRLLRPASSLHLHPPLRARLAGGESSWWSPSYAKASFSASSARNGPDAEVDTVQHGTGAQPPPRRARTSSQRQSMAAAPIEEKKVTAARPRQPHNVEPMEFMEPKRKNTIRSRKPKPKKEADDKQQEDEKVFKPDPSSAFPHLPAIEDWPSVFQRKRGYINSYRRMLSNPETIRKVIDALDLPARRARLADPEQKLTIVEGWAGAGTMTRQFLENENVERVIAMEDMEASFPWLEALSSDPTLGENAKKLHALKRDSFTWGTYKELVDSGGLDHIEEVRDQRHTKPDYSEGHFSSPDWKAESPIVFVLTVPNAVHGEQFIVQLVQSIASRVWLFRHSRVTLCFIASEIIGERVVAGPGSYDRSRFTVIAQALGKPRILLNSSHFKPDSDHFFPSESLIGPRHLKGQSFGELTPRMNQPSGKTKIDQCLFTVEPYAKPYVSGTRIDNEAYEYVTRHIFVFKRRSLSKGLMHLAPGAGRLIETLQEGTHPAIKEFGPRNLNADTPIQDMSIEDLVALARIFERWPFRPEHFYDEGLVSEVRDIDDW